MAISVGHGFVGLTVFAVLGDIDRLVENASAVGEPHVALNGTCLEAATLHDGGRHVARALAVVGRLHKVSVGVDGRRLLVLVLRVDELRGYALPVLGVGVVGLDAIHLEVVNGSTVGFPRQQGRAAQGLNSQRILQHLAVVLVVELVGRQRGARFPPRQDIRAEDVSLNGNIQCPSPGRRNVISLRTLLLAEGCFVAAVADNSVRLTGDGGAHQRK